jgi:hypothetical protein
VTKAGVSAKPSTEGDTDKAARTHNGTSFGHRCVRTAWLGVGRTDCVRFRKYVFLVVASESVVATIEDKYLCVVAADLEQK